MDRNVNNRGFVLCTEHKNRRAILLVIFFRCILFTKNMFEISINLPFFMPGHHDFFHVVKIYILELFFVFEELKLRKCCWYIILRMFKLNWRNTLWKCVNKSTAYSVYSLYCTMKRSWPWLSWYRRPSCPQSSWWCWVRRSSGEPWPRWGGEGPAGGWSARWHYPGWSCSAPPNL